MGMGIISDEELEKELSKDDKVLINGKVLDKPKEHGRNKGDVNVPASLREIIAVDALENGNKSANALAKSLGISESSVSAYKNGATSTATYNGGDRELRDKVNRTKTRIVNKASNRLKSALDEITTDKLKAAKVTEISGVARDMSAIIKNMEPPAQGKEEGSGKGTVNVILYRPQQRSEDDYDVVVVED